MIIDALPNFNRYLLNNYFKNLFEIFQKGDFSETIKGPCKSIPLNYTTKEFDYSKFENHRRFLDIHVILEGIETIGITPVEDLEINLKYNVEGDYELYSGRQVHQEIVLKKGNFLLLFPGEAHVTAGKYDGKESGVKKIVYKIPVL